MSKADQAESNTGISQSVAICYDAPLHIYILRN